nr:8008_t:CDS:10 [Entrophospora candida]CAG8441630.1 3599_t:CDS:10 [Entrophospora candida]
MSHHLPTSPKIQPQFTTLKTKPTTHLVLEVSSPAAARRNSSAAASIKSFNSDIRIKENTAVDDYLMGLMNRSASNSSNEQPSNNYLPAFGGTRNMFNGHKRKASHSEQDSDLYSELSEKSNTSSDSNDCPIANNELSKDRSKSDSSMKEYSGHRRKYGNEDPGSASWTKHSKHFFILSSAGKPVYTRCINAGQHKFVFLLKGPLYLVAVSRTNESELQLREQLNYLYNQILSQLTSKQLTKIFEQRTNFDLRKLLGGTEPFFDNLATSMNHELGFMLGSVQCVRMSKTLRDKIGSIMQFARSKDLLYAMLITDSKLITSLGPRKHNLHPSDIHLIFNTVNGSSSFKSYESWAPICLPGFNSKGFLYVYLCYIAVNTCLVLISPDKEKFYELSEARNVIFEKLESTGSLKGIEEALQNDSYSIDDIGVPGLRHFIYKSTIHVQLFKLYRHVHDRIHSKFRPLKVYYCVSNSETILGWVTSSFELYASFRPHISKTALTTSSHALLKWIRKEEENLFI